LNNDNFWNELNSINNAGAQARGDQLSMNGAGGAQSKTGMPFMNFEL